MSGGFSLFDIILFSVCVGVLFTYVAFLLYEWLNNKKKRCFEIDCNLNFALPAAYKIYYAMQRRLRLEVKDEVMDRYRKLYVEKNDDEIRKNYFIKHIVLFLYTCLICLLIMLMTVLSCQKNKYIISGYYIEKNDVGGNQKNINVETNINGLRKDTEIIVPERKYSEKEIAKQAEKVKKYIYKYYLGKNKSADKIKTNLYLMKKVKGSKIGISWTSDNENIVSDDGKTKCKELSEPENVSLTAVLKYDSYKEKLRFNVTVLPVKKSEEEKLWLEWNKLLKNAIEKTKSLRYLKLPDKVNGMVVKYKTDRYSRLWQVIPIIILMFFIVPVMAESMSKSKLSDREKQLKLLYPEMIEKFVLLINAGLPVKNAWIRIAESADDDKIKNSYLMREMLLTKRQMENGLSEEKAYEMFGRRIGILSYMKFCTLLVQNMKKGTADLIRILEYEAVDVFNERKENAKILGEEASTKLLMPMMIMMIIIFAIILYAAFAGM